LLLLRQVAQRAVGLGDRLFGYGQRIGGIALGGLGLVDVALQGRQALLQVGPFLFGSLLLLGALGDGLAMRDGSPQRGADGRSRQQRRGMPPDCPENLMEWRARGGARLTEGTQFYFDFPWLATALSAASMADWSPR
jgi:hypothetical protein